MIQIGPRRARALIILCIYAGPGCQQLLGERDIALHCCLMQRCFTSASCYESAEYFGVIPHPGPQACESRGLSNPKIVLMLPASWTITLMTSLRQRPVCVVALTEAAFCNRSCAKSLWPCRAASCKMVKPRQCNMQRRIPSTSSAKCVA